MAIQKVPRDAESHARPSRPSPVPSHAGRPWASSDCSFDEDAGDPYYDDDTGRLAFPDFRVVDNAGETLLIEVKSVKLNGPLKPFGVRKSDVEAWRRWGADRYLIFRVHCQQEGPIDAKTGGASVRITDTEMLVDGRKLIDELERRIAWVFFRFGGWEVEQELQHGPDGDITAIDLVARPSTQVTRGRRSKTSPPSACSRPCMPPSSTRRRSLQRGRSTSLSIDPNRGS